MRERIEKALRPSGMKRRPAQKSKVRQCTSARMRQAAEGGQTDRDRQAKAVPAPRRLSPPAKRPYCSLTQGVRLDGLMRCRFWSGCRTSRVPARPTSWIKGGGRYGKLHKKLVVVLEGLCRKLGSLGVNKLETVRSALSETRRSETPEEAVTVLGALQIVVAKIRNHLLEAKYG